jgi:kanamycin kinase
MLTLPPEFIAHTGTVLAVERPVQGLYFSAYIITAERGRFVLKIGQGAARTQELHDEFRVLTSLAFAQPFVARPVTWSQQGDQGWFLFTCIEGENMLTALDRADEAGKHHLVAEFARALRRVHAWAPAVPRPADWFAEALSLVAANVASGAVANPIDHSGWTKGRDPHALLADLRPWAATVAPDLVWSHLDYCLPNVIVRENQIVGVIDWSRGCWADRRIDLAAAVWTIGHNLGGGAYVDTFLTTYGYPGTAHSLREFEALWVML